MKTNLKTTIDKSKWKIEMNMSARQPGESRIDMVRRYMSGDPIADVSPQIYHTDGEKDPKYEIRTDKWVEAAKAERNASQKTAQERTERNFKTDELPGTTEVKTAPNNEG